MEINLNQQCTVVLNERGIEALSAYYDRLNLSQPKVYSVGDRYKSELWDIMNKFGSYTFMGPQPPFETTIYLEDL